MNQQNKLQVFNTLSRKKEIFEPINPPFVGMYVCGPTVYGDAHLGNCRTYVSYDLIYRYLLHLGYKVRYVRNITDVGHLVNDADEGEDKIAKKARLEKLEPMEIVQRYTLGFHEVMQKFNTLPPGIEPTATGHIVEQIEMTQKLIDHGYAYVSKGSVYFDVLKYNQNFDYGKLSGRVLEELMKSERNLEGQDEKRNTIDFALWKLAKPEHIMRWPSPWGNGFPGWHIECSVMSTKYLGIQFDIHGGGMDLKFPHHECEIAQNVGAEGKEPVKYWLHTNMLTVGGQRMGKSLGNYISPDQLFSGNHPMLSKAYSPMTVRFFMLQTHYASTLDFSDEALKASEKGFKKIINGLKIVKAISHPETQETLDVTLNNDIEHLSSLCYQGMNDDFNSPKVIAGLFNLLKYINSFHNKVLNIAAIKPEVLALLKNTYILFVEEILGLKEEKYTNPNILDEVLHTLLQTYSEAKNKKEYATVDLIRKEVKKQGIIIKDTKEGVEWGYEE
jgi:cysteinyl-tRNA synthetase